MNELKVGLLTLAAIASVVVMTLKITANKSGFGDYIEYKTIVKDASGLFEKTSIKVAGINSGRVKKIELYGSEALITFEMLEKIKITKNSKLQIKAVGLLGDKFLDIYLGDPNSERLPSGSIVPSEGGSGFEDLTKDAGELVKEIKEVAILVKQSLKDEKDENVLKKIISNINDLTASLKRMTEKNETKINDIISDVKNLTQQLAYETNRYEKNSFMSDLSKVGPILDKADTAISDLKIIIADLKEGKGTVGKLLRDDAVVDQVSQTLSSVNRLVNRINNIEADIGLSSGINTNNGTDTRFDLDIYPAPERFFRIGIVTNNYGPELEKKKTTFTSTDGGPETEVQKREVNDSAFKFNMQIGRRIQRLALRAGLIETTGGIGVDYFFPDWGIRTGMEVFDYQKDAGPNLRLITEIRLWNVLFTRIAGEDLVSKDGSQSATISFGLRFNDQDLAALIGLLAR